MTGTTARRWMPAALIASLAGNMFLGGLILSHTGRHGGPPKPAMFIERMAEALPPADAALLRRVLDANRDLLEDEHASHRDMPRRIRAALLAEPFDPQAMVAVFSDTEEREQRARRQVQRALAEAAAAMSPEGRRRMAEFHL